MKTKLSDRQRQVLKLILAGYSQKEICSALDLHSNSVCTYKRIIMEKWNVENLIELVVKSIKLGYLDIDEERFN
jgi:DNA-binding NarL/FixJ family response regulator